MSPSDLNTLVSCIDLTSLHTTDTNEKIQDLCHQASTPQGPVAAVCVYPQFVSFAWKQLIETPINIATVIHFPGAPYSIQDIPQAILDGASEIDAVMPHDDNGEFVRECKKYCGNKALLKIILETGELDKKEIAKKSKIAIEHGADFLKTSTGKIPIGATPQAAQVILETIKISQKNIGLKVSGGIRTLEDAEIYVKMTKEILGENAFCAKRFRIGTSQLLRGR